MAVWIARSGERRISSRGGSTLKPRELECEVLLKFWSPMAACEVLATATDRINVRSEPRRPTRGPARSASPPGYRYLEGIETPPPGLFLGTAVRWALQVVYRQRQLGIALR